jgi:biopolymer transport protein ExbD
MRPLAERSPSGLMGAHTLPDMTPMVDVVMVILIFFMASSALVGHELLMRARVAPEAPPASGAPIIAPAALVIRLTAPADVPVAHGLGLADRPVAELVTRIEARAADLRDAGIPFIIEPAPGVPYQTVVDVLAALDRAGVREVALR